MVYISVLKSYSINNTEQYDWESKKKFIFSNLKVSGKEKSVDTCFRINANGTWIRTDCGLKLTFYCERKSLEHTC